MPLSRPLQSPPSKALMRSWVAPHTVRFYESGATCADPVSGDVIIVDHNTFVAKAISFGEGLLEWRDRSLKGFTWCDHVAFIRQAGEHDLLYLQDQRRYARKDEFVVSEMAFHGHQFRSLAAYQPRLYAVVHFDVPDEARAAVLNADRRCSKVKYGFLQYAPLVIDCLSGAKWAGSYGDTMICSTEVALCATNLYWFFDLQPSGVMPCHVARLVGASH